MGCMMSQPSDDASPRHRDPSEHLLKNLQERVPTRPTKQPPKQTPKSPHETHDKGKVTDHGLVSRRPFADHEMNAGEPIKSLSPEEPCLTNIPTKSAPREKHDERSQKRSRNFSRPSPQGALERTTRSTANQPGEEWRELERRKFEELDRRDIRPRLTRQVLHVFSKGFFNPKEAKF